MLMNVLLALLLIASNWLYDPHESPPAEVEGVDLNLKNDEFALIFFGLSEGEAALLQFATGENILINTGGTATQREVQELLNLFDVKKINAIVITRQDLFSKENLKWLMNTYDVQKIYTNEWIQSSIGDQKNVEIWIKGVKKAINDVVSLEVLFNGNEEAEGLDILLTTGETDIIYLSSSSIQSEKMLLQKTFNEVNMVKVPSFGKENAISSGLIKHLDPQNAYIYHSKKTPYSPDTIGLFHDAWIQTYHADKHGTIILKFSDDNYEIISLYRKK